MRHAIASISGVINQISDISSTIATAEEEQNATTNEMSRNVSQAAHSSGEITSNIEGAAQAAESTSALTTRKRQHSNWWKTPMSTGGWSSNSVSRPRRIARAKAQSRFLRGCCQPALLLKANHTLRVPGAWLEVRLIFPHLPAAPTASHSNTHSQCRLRSDVVGRRVRSPLSSSQIPAPA